jgi:Ala-tRNA(Pro) deacylase
MHPSERLVRLLQASGRPFEILEHPYAETSEQVAVQRGTPVGMGGKSLVFKLQTGFALFVLSGERRTDNRLLRKHLGIQRLRFARLAELASLTGLTPGCVPPFGRPIFDLPLYVDAATAAQEEIAFSLASHTRSVRMRTEDWLAIAQPADVYTFAVRAV